MEKYLSDKGEKVFIMVGASWCQPCNKMTPDFNSLSNMAKYKEINFIKLDIDENEEICNELDIEKLPTFIYYNNLVEINRDITIKTLLDLNKFINKF